MKFEEWVRTAANIMEALGVATIVLGVFTSAAMTVIRGRRADGSAAYRAFRQTLGRGILLGLEFLVAGDIIRTVSHVPSLTNVAVLAGIVLIRTFLSFTLEVELEGRWPWQRRADA